MQVQAETAHFQIGQSLAYTVPAVFICLFLGTWSDHVGRKPVIAMVFLGAVFEATLVSLTMYLKLPLFVILIGAFFNGLGGYFPALTLAVIAYIADTTHQDKRALRFGEEFY